MLTVHSAPNRQTRRLLELQDRLYAKREARVLRELATGLSTGSSSGMSLTVNQTLRQPRLISRDLVNIILQRGGFLADRLLVRGSADEVAGGTMLYQRSGSSYLDRDVEEIAEDADWPRTGYSEQMRTELVKQYGLEVPVSMLNIRRNRMSVLTAAQRRLANQIVKFVDGKAITMLRTDPDILTMNASNWTLAAADIISDVANGQEAMDVIDEGLTGSVLVLPKTMRVNFLANTALRSALTTPNGSEAVRTGNVSAFLGLDAIYFTTRIPDDEALLIDPGVAGVIADEAPAPEEGWQAYDPGGGFQPIYVQIYQEDRPKRKVVAAGRWPAMALVEPRAVMKFTTTTA